jgi:hypothetical protein
MKSLPAHNEAVFSPDRQFRYTLESAVGDGALGGKGLVNFIMLNPSTADETQDDPSVRRCKAYAAAWGYDRAVVTNVFAFRSTDPRALRKHPSPVGPRNDEWITRSARRADKVIAAWGLHSLHMDRHFEVVRMLVELGVRPEVLALSKAGIPKHPLYLSGGLKPRMWDAALRG